MTNHSPDYVGSIVDDLDLDDSDLVGGDAVETSGAGRRVAGVGYRDPQIRYDVDYSTRLSKYARHPDVRSTYRDLPFQAFWTWLTGKSLWDKPPKKPYETLLTEWQLMLQLCWSWSIVIGSVSLCAWLFNHDGGGLPWYLLYPLYAVLMVLTTNRTRGLLHTFHYTSHGATLSDMGRARAYATWIMSVPIMHVTWEEYRRIHGVNHHSRLQLCTDLDPDQVFMTDHGFRKGMSETEFWFKIFLAPFHPMRIYEHIAYRVKHNFFVKNRVEVAARLTFWVLLLGISWKTGFLEELALFYLVPLFLITQYSSWVQHISEHLWFAERPGDIPLNIHSSAMTWGRFLGRPYPIDETGFRKLVKLVPWALGCVFIDLPIRIFSFMQDLPSHDFHHRSSAVNFWRIAQERRAQEGLPSRLGPMTETWGITESVLILRDHLCRGESDPFGIYRWYRDNYVSQPARSFVK